MTKIKGFEAALQALRGLDSSSQERILRDIAKMDAEMAERLKKNILTFADLIRINPQGLIRLIQEVPEPQLVLSLRGMTNEFIESLLKPLSKRKADLIKEALAQLGPQALKKVEGAQKEILQKAKSLEEQGLLIFTEGEDPLV